MGQVSDVNHTTIGASRYAAWERTVASAEDKSDQILLKEVKQRFYGAPGTLIKSNLTDGLEKDQTNTLWNHFSYGATVKSPEDYVALSMSNNSTPGNMASTMGDILSGAGHAISALNDNVNFDLENDGLMTATVGVNVIPERLHEEYDDRCAYRSIASTYACIRREHVILVDSWGSSSPEQTASRVRGFVPASIFEPVADVIKTLNSGYPDISIIPPNPLQEFDGLEPGYVAPDVIPEDRLSP
jgi:hypothetical protein